MARPLRIERASGWYHLTARGNERPDGSLPGMLRGSDSGGQTGQSVGGGGGTGGVGDGAIGGAGVGGTGDEGGGAAMGEATLLREVKAAVERVPGKRWVAFRGRHGDLGRNLVLYLVRKGCGLGYRELGAQAQIQYVSAATAVRRFGARLAKDRALARLLERATKEMHNE